MSDFQVVGIDVSRWQGEMNWEIAKPKISFAFIKATQGQTGQDAQFVRNWRETRERGIVRGAYHFYSPRRSPVNDPKLQAINFADALDGDWGELPPMLDCESDPDGLSIQEMQDRIYKFRNAFFGATGKEIGIYTRASWWDPQVTNGRNANTDIPHIDGDGMRWLWAAHYNSSISAPYLPWDWQKRYGPGGWTFWQWSADGNGKGAEYGAESKSIDLNRYNGTVSQFENEFNVKLDGGIEPEPEPEPEPGAGIKFKVTVPYLNIRTGPGTQFADVGDLLGGTVITASDVGGSDAWVEFEPGKWCCVRQGVKVYLEKV